MGNLLFIAGVILSIGWLVGFLGYNAGGAFHLVIIMAFVALLLSIVSVKKTL